MKYFDWSIEKNQELKVERGVSFDEIVIAFEDGRVLDLYKNPNQREYPGQQIFVVKIDNYAFLVPFIEDDRKIFLKTIIPSRKATKKYIIQHKNIKT